MPGFFSGGAPIKLFHYMTCANFVEKYYPNPAKNIYFLSAKSNAITAICA